jgi:protein-S-isoprenylcysteine O-methyltransferase Ste14
LSIRRDFPDIPPVWWAGFVASQWLVARGLPPARSDAAWLGWTAAVLCAVGLGLVAWSALWFARRRTTIEPRERPTTLIVEGPFRLNRNPIYSGMALMLLGWGLWLGSLPAAALALCFPPVITARFVQGEEETLRRVFGAEAEAYIARTRRW